jgi:Zn-dependent peptidase ImmA (M78 family)
MSSFLWDRIQPKESEIVRGFISETPVRVGALANELGIRVVKSPLAPKISGLIQPSSEAPSGFEIRINKYESPERQRFTIAHEISHYLLHRDDIGSGVVDSVMYRSSLTSRKETEANRLAADIVMPVRSVARELDRLGGKPIQENVEELAAMFKVSIPAMKVRLGVA